MSLSRGIATGKYFDLVMANHQLNHKLTVLPHNETQAMVIGCNAFSQFD
jgi:hypothetical protein